ncbi:peripheral plasma membrane protein CASK-like [Artemia franciscana]|uniref:peripheral plasma membrane protein CASK-like n=1 Tax=Artemia franciscana TaxID=6661 RepID=UPI0032DACFCB
MGSMHQEEDVLFDEVYNVQDIISRGPCSVIRKCVHKETGKTFVVKIVDVAKFTSMPGLSTEDLKREATLCHLLKHPHIVELLETYSSEGMLYMVFEFMEGGNLCSEIVERASSGFVYSEAVASHYLKQVLEAVKYCHDNDIIHRGIRPSCVLLGNRDNSAPVKLRGFSAAVQLEKNELAMCASIINSAPQFQSPEQMNQQPHGKSSDIWALGVFLHVLLTGTLPFMGVGDNLKENINSGLLHFECAVFENVSDNARDLLQRMLVLEPQNRITIEDALNHCWIKSREKCAFKVHLGDAVEEMKKLCSRYALKSFVKNCVSSTHWVIPATVDLSGDSYSDIEEDDIVGICAVNKVLNSLDAVQCLQDAPSFSKDPKSLKGLLDDSGLHQLLNVYHTVSLLSIRSNSDLKPGQTNGYLCLKELSDILVDPRFNNRLDGTVELRNILNGPRLKALFQAHDVLAHEVYADNSTRVTPPPLLPPAYLGLTPSAGFRENWESVNGDAHQSDHVTRVRLVQFQKNTDEPMGITLKLTEDNRCIVARIMHGGMIHRQATLHVGDEIREINGQPVAHQSVEALQKMLRDLRGSITFKIVPSFRNAPPPCELFRIKPLPIVIYVRAQFDYDPLEDDLIPCAQAGLSFHCGDVLQIISKDDGRWWQARRDADGPAGPAGLIPSPELIEYRYACSVLDKGKKEQVNCSFFIKKKKQSKDKNSTKHNAIFDQLDLRAYEEVVRLPTFKRKTLVLLGAHGVGRRHIKNTIIGNHPEKYAYPIPHTTRAPRKDEENGRNYFFISHEEMMSDIAANEYLEYGTHEEAMYGTKLETIRQIHREGKVAILDVEPQALKILRSAEFAPYVVFVAAPAMHNVADFDGSLERLIKESDALKSTYGHHFDLTVVNEEIEETIRSIESTFENLATSQQWVSVSWVY